MAEKPPEAFSSDPRWPVDRNTDSNWEDITMNKESAMEWFGALKDALWSSGHHLDKKAKILEIGTGGGILLHSLSQQGFDFVGIDGRPRHNGALPIAAARVERLPFADETFDVVLSRGTFSHSYKQDSAKMLEEVGRVLKPGGIFYGLPHGRLLDGPEVTMTAKGMAVMPISTQHYSFFKKASG